MSRIRATIAAFIAAVAPCSIACAVAADRAQAALIAELTKTHPRVSEWSVTLRYASGTTVDDPVADDATIRVTQLGSRSAVHITSQSPGEPSRERTLWFDVSGNEPMVVAKRTALSGEAVSASDGEIAARDPLTKACEPLVRVQDLDNKRARRGLHAGEIVCANAIEDRPPVSRGESVRVRYISSRVSLSTSGIAQTDANVGQRVIVMNPASRESFAAWVTGASEVVVHE